MPHRAQLNLFERHSTSQASDGSETVQILAGKDMPGATRVERIVSKGNCPSEAGFWYDQAENEWVTVLAGKVSSRFPAGRSTSSDDWMRTSMNGGGGPKLTEFWVSPTVLFRENAIHAMVGNLGGGRGITQ